MELFVSLLVIFTTSFVIALSGAVMPGPMLTVTIDQTRNSGIATGPKIIVGHVLVEIVILVLLLIGFGPLLQHNYTVVSIGLIGAFALTYLGVNMLRNLDKIEFNTEKDFDDKKNLVFAGAFTSISNPYWFIWWTTIGLAYITYSLGYGYLGVISFFGGHILADFLWYFLISFVFTKGENFITKKVYKTIIGVCGITLLVFAFLFGANSINILM